MCFYMAPEIRIELILTDSKSAVLPLHNSGIKSIQNVKEHIVLYDAKTNYLIMVVFSETLL